MTLTIAIIGGYIGLSKDGDAAFSPSAMVLVASLSGCGFWLLDAMNKSLQMVYIYSSRDLERFLRAGATGNLISPSIALRFEKKQGRHLRPAIKNLTEQSVWPCYLLPIGLACILASVRSSTAGGCHIFWSPLCVPARDFHVALAGLFVPMALLLLSLAWNSKRPWLRYLGTIGRWRRTRAVDIVRGKIAEMVGEESSRAKRLWPYKADFSGEDFVVFVDSQRRMGDPGYLAERTRCLNALGLAVFRMDERHVRYPLDGHDREYQAPDNARPPTHHCELGERLGLVVPDESFPVAAPRPRRTGGKA